MKRLLVLILIVATVCTACHREEKNIVLDKSMRLLVRFNGKYGYCDQGGIMVISLLNSVVLSKPAETSAMISSCTCRTTA